MMYYYHTITKTKIGDVMIIPESWGHGVLNLQESVAVATEVKANVWRSKPPSQIVLKLPNDNR